MAPSSEEGVAAVAVPMDCCPEPLTVEPFTGAIAVASGNSCSSGALPASFSSAPCALDNLDETALKRWAEAVLRKSSEARLFVAERCNLTEDLAAASEAERQAREDQYKEVKAASLDDAMGMEDMDFYERAKFVPMRLTYDERKYMRLIDSTIHVSKYTDQLDAGKGGGANVARKLAIQMRQLCAILTGIMVAHSYERGQQLMQSREYGGKAAFFQTVLEIGRRYKILNPERMRDSYGKLMYFMQDSRKPEVRELLEFDSVVRVRTVYDVLAKNGRGLEMLRDPQLRAATSEIMPEGKSRAQVQREIKIKEVAIKNLSKSYCSVARKRRNNHGYRGYYGFGLMRSSYQDSESEEDIGGGGEALTEDEVEQCIYSLGDHSTFLRFNREPCDRLIRYLQEEFDPEVPGPPELSLAIEEGVAGARLSHNHRRQYVFVLQSMTLWREVLDNMFQLWHLAEEDLLDEERAYQLTDTGQGFQRLQPSPRSLAAMQKILSRVQRKVGGWMGSTTVHLGDHNVPNALMFIDKYIQIPRILGPLVLTLERIPDLCQGSSAMKSYLNAIGGGSARTLQRTILADFFRHAFDGSGADNFFDAGSCIDGRLTSAWNWCSSIEKKPWFPVFLLTGFTGFDGKEGF